MIDLRVADVGRRGVLGEAALQHAHQLGGVLVVELRASPPSWSGV